MKAVSKTTKAWFLHSCVRVLVFGISSFVLSDVDPSFSGIWMPPTDMYLLARITYLLFMGVAVAYALIATGYLFTWLYEIARRPKGNY